MAASEHDSAISPSQDEEFHRAGFLTDSDSSLFSAGDDDRLSSSVSATPIVMESLPESPQQGAAADGQFETPPEDFASADGSQTMPTNVSVAMAVEPGYNAADLGFPKVIQTTTEVNSSESKKAGAQKRGNSSDSSESPLKRSNLTTSDSLVDKVAGLGLPSHVVELIKLFDVLAPKSGVDVPSPSGEENAGCHGDSDRRKAKKSKGSLKQDLLGMLEATMRITGQLPPESESESGAQDATVEIAKSSGMKFPKPEQWPPGKEL